MTLRVVLLMRSLGRGGAERQALLLARGLQARGIRVTIVTLYQPTDTIDATSGLDVRSVQKRHRWDLGAILRLHRAIAREAPHVVYSFLTVPNVLAALGAAVVRRSHLIWGIRSSRMDLTRYDWLVGATHWLEGRLAGVPDLIICNSAAGRNDAVARGLPAAKVHVICNGFDTERFRPNAAARNRFRAAWGVDDGTAAIGMVARLDPMKDYPTFLRAAALLAKDRRDVRFVLIGDGSSRYRAALRRMIHQLGLEAWVIWQHPQLDMTQVYPAFDVLCCASASESFPNAVGEAMACGVPCVVTDVGDARRIVGAAGIVVPPRDPAALAGGLELMLQRLHAGDLRDPVYRVQATRGRVARKYSVERMIVETEHAFRTIAASVLADAKPS